MSNIYVFLLLAVLLTLGDSATVTYYTDSQCKNKGGGPPGLLKNPTTLDLGECVQLTGGNGNTVISVKSTACATNGQAISLEYTGSATCTGSKQTITVDEGKCVAEGNTYSIVTCGGVKATGTLSVGAIVGIIIGSLVVAAIGVYYYYFYYLVNQKLAMEAGKQQESSNPVHA